MMCKLVRVVILAVLFPLGTGCANFSEQRYPTYDAAMRKARQVENPPVLHMSSVPDDIPGMVVFASVHGDFPDGSSSIGTQAYRLKEEAIKRGLEPDVLIYEPRGSVYAGSTSQYIGYGASFSTPVYRPQATVYCYRLSPCSLGLRWDANQMIVGVDEETRQCGIQEGDTLVSINGRAIKASGQMTAPSDSEALAMAVGQSIKLIWIRPGTGRMEGEAVAREPMPMPVVTSIAVEPTKNKKETQLSRRNRPVH